MAQLTFSDVEMGMGRKRETRRSRFLDRLSKSCPWDAWLALVREARGTDAGARGAGPAMGRPRVDDLVLLRMYMVQVCFGLSDRECEDQVWDSATMRSFVGVAPFEVPDATTPREFRHLLERCGVGEAMVSSAFGSAADGGLAVSRGTIVDATLVESPSSTRNADGARDPDAHQAKKGQNWHLGHELGVGAGAETGVPHSVRMDAANVHDLDQVPDLVREGGDASGTVPATSASGGGRRSPATPPSPASSGPSPRGARRSAGTTWSQGPPSRPPAASSSTSSTGSRTYSGCGRRAIRGSPRCPTRPSPPSPQPAA